MPFFWYCPLPKQKINQNKTAILWLIFFSIAGILTITLYKDGEQQDSGYHYLFARWAFRYPDYFVSVWGRPLFTLIYSLPAQLGYQIARLSTLIICLLTGWQTYKLSNRLGAPKSAHAIPFLFLQPAFFLISGTVLTEPLFALIMAIVIRIHLSGRLLLASFIASSLIMVRPEGFFVGIIYGFFILLDRKSQAGLASRLVKTLVLGIGMLVWWSTAMIITRDPLWIAHNWPPDWQALGKANGTGPIWWYLVMLPLIAGPLLLPPFLLGFRHLMAERKFRAGLSIFFILLCLHSLIFWQGWFGSAGYPRYFVCVSPITAIITMTGWNLVEDKLRRHWQPLVPFFSGTLFALSLVFCIFYIDGWGSTRDAFAVDEMTAWLKNHDIRFKRLITSQAYMRIALDRDPLENADFSSHLDKNIELIADAAPGTLIFWDSDTGVKWYRLKADDIDKAGYTELRSQSYSIKGYLPWPDWKLFGGPRYQTLHVFIKPDLRPEIRPEMERNK